MQWTIAVILLVLWILGMVSGAELGWWIHLFLVFALVALILAVAQRGRVATQGAGR
ncbi:MAG: lmo0937 family membrane protein [Myxococcaceae bacterium]